MVCQRRRHSEKTKTAITFDLVMILNSDIFYKYYWKEFQLERSATLSKYLTFLYLLIYLFLLGWLAHLVSQFPCNTRMIVDASTSPPVSHVK